MNPTVKQIADTLGYAKSTVSMALRDNPTVNEKTRRKIQQAAREMNYQPNALAQAMFTGRAKVIGFATQTVASEYLSMFLDGLCQEAEALGYLIKIIRTDWQFDAKALASQCQSQCLSGLICGESHEQSMRDLADITSKLNLPVSHLSGPPELPGLISIRCDDHTGIFQAIEHLHGLGHRKIGYIGGNRHSISTHVREAGFRHAMKKMGLKIQSRNMVSGEYEIDQTIKATHQLLENKHRPTALFCANDHMAMTAIRTARAMGIHTPNDLSVIGCSNLNMTEFCAPPLTSIAQPQVEMGKLAVKRIVNVIQSLDQNSSVPVMDQTPLPTQLVIRESTGPVAG